MNAAAMNEMHGYLNDTKTRGRYHFHVFVIRMRGLNFGNRHNFSVWSNFHFPISENNSLPCQNLPEIIDFTQLNLTG